MFKFIKPKGPHLTAERQKLQKELFAYRRTLQHGFPHKPTALAWDPTLRLLCVGTATGAVKVFGRPGVEFYGQHPNAIAVNQLVFIPNVGRVVSLCEDNSLHLWEVDKSSLIQVRSQALEGKLKKISAICVDAAGKQLLLGTEGGNIYILDLHSFTMTPDIIYQDVIMQSAPADFKLNPGAVESVIQRPNPDNPDQILIGYNRGLIVLWDRSTNAVVKTYTPAQQLESLSWHDDGEGFTSTHNDGSYITWTVDCEDGKPQASNTNATYGPFACKATLKLIRKDFKGQPLITFSGGLPRSNYGDKFSVTVLHDDRHVVFDFTSKIVDFVIIDAQPASDDTNHTDEASDNDSSTTSESSLAMPEALIVLAEEELVAIDLQCDEWKMINLPYMVSLHASAVTCSHHVQGVPEDLWEQLKKAGQSQSQSLYSNRAWPVDGGELLCSKGASPRREILLTGHEDGTVRFWDAGGVTLTPLYKFNTSQFFTGDDLDEIEPSPDDEDEWPPFRKTGIFDPYSDDPRLAVKRVTLCPLSGTLVVAGTAGHIIVAKFDTEVLDGEIHTTTMNIVSDRDGFVWKGHSQLTPRTGDIHQARGFQLQSLLQLYPPAAITCCVLQADWGLVAAGTAHGLALYDYTKHKPVTVKCTLNPNDLTGAGDAPISRRKSFKKSLRESFRRLRKGRSQRGQRSGGTTTTTPASGGGILSPLGKKAPPPSDADNSESKPVERQIEARPTDDSMGSFVRCLYFARTFLISVQNTVPTLWAGTNSGTVLVFTITIPHRPQTSQQPISPSAIPTTQCQLAKEIQLKHRAPVIAIAVLDGSHRPLPEALEVERGVSPLPDTTQSHRVVIASEEQFKVFQLPSLKAWGKYKLTAHEGARIRRMNFANFTCNSLDGSNTPYSEIDLLCLTNLGDCLVLSIPDLKRQLNAAAVKKEDINGISSLIFTKDAEALYMHSSSELQRLSLAAQHLTSARCYLSLKEGCRDNNVTSEDEKDPAKLKETESTEQDQSAVTGDIKEENVNRVSGGGSLVNGAGSSENIADVEKNDSSIKENGDDTLHSLHNSTVTSSIGDITIDSVKEHLSTSTAAAVTAANAQTHNEQEINTRLSSLTVTKTQNIISTTTTNNGQTESSVTQINTVVTSGGGGGSAAAPAAPDAASEEA